MPHGQITRVEVPALKRASCGLRVLEVPPHDDVSTCDNLANGLAVAGDVHELITRGLCGGIDDTGRGRGGKSVSLTSGKLGPFGKRERKPRGLGVIASKRPIGLTVACRITQNDSQMRTNGKYWRTSSHIRGQAGNLWLPTERAG